MLLLASMVLVSSTWVAAPGCPTSFNYLNTTVGAISNSSELRLCASKAVLIKGTNGSLSLVLGTSSSSPPVCLVYPNGLSPDLTYSLLTSGHVGCWSLYPPTQVIAIVNIGKPSQAKLQAALKTFRPTNPKIFIKPSNSIRVGTKILLSSSAINQVIKTKILNLPAQVRFIPFAYKWTLSLGSQQLLASKIAKPSYSPTQVGKTAADLSVTYSVEYTFPGLVPWTKVSPSIVLDAAPLSFEVGGNPTHPSWQPPKLVQKPCSLGSISWRC